MKRTKTERINLYLTSRQYEYIEKKAKQWKTNKSDAVRTIIQKNLDWDECIRVRGELTVEKRQADNIFKSMAH